MRLLAMALCGVMLAAVCSCKAEPAVSSDQPDPTSAVIVVHPQRGVAIRSITLPGDVRGFYEATLYAKVTGYLQTLNVDKGDWVKKGQLLARIEVPELHQNLAQAKAKLAVSRTAYDRLKQVWESDHRLVARQDVDIAEGNFQAEQAHVDELQALVGYTQIIAPFSAVVTARFVDPGALIGASGGQQLQAAADSGKGAATPVLSVAAIDRMRVYIYVPEDDVGLIRRGMPAMLALREYLGQSFAGEVARFATSLDLSTRTMLTEIDVENPRHQLYPGMYAEVKLQLERHAGVLTVPPSAVAGDGRHSEVFVVRRDRLQKVPITTGIRTGIYVEVTSGLSGDEQVVNNFTPALYEGERVRAQMLAPQSAETVSDHKYD